MHERLSGIVSLETASFAIEFWSLDISIFYLCKNELLSRKNERDELIEKELFNVLLVALLTEEADNNYTAFLFCKSKLFVSRLKIRIPWFDEFISSSSSV